MSDPWTLEHAIEIAKIGASKHGYRTYDGSGGIWRNDEFPDAVFDDWGLACATAIILNAVVAGKLVIRPEMT